MSKDPYRFFRIEARELIEALSAGILAIERGERPAEGVAPILRAAHTLKGAARVVRLPEIAQSVHLLEDRLVPFAGTGAVPPNVVREILDDIARIEQMVIAIDQPAPSVTPTVAPSPVTPVVATVRATPPAAPLPDLGREPITAGEPALEAVPTPNDAASARPRGEAPAGVGRGGFETIRVDLSRMDLLLGDILEISTRLGAARHAAAELTHARDGARALARLLTSTFDREERAAADNLASEIDRIGQGLSATVQTLEREIRRSRDLASSLRLVSVNAILPQVERSARDAAHQLGKDVAFESTGGDVRIDPHVLNNARDILLHLVRNAVAHGIEPVDVRVAAGKAPRGLIRVEVKSRGRLVHFACCDDGGGIDTAAIRAAAVARGQLTPDAPDDLVLEAMLRGGISTATALTEVAGRGVGLDAVQDLVARSKGQLRVHTQAGAGCCFELIVPVSAASLASMAVRVLDQIVHVPLDGVLKAARYAAHEIAATDEGASVVHEGRAIPLADLAQVLGQPADECEIRNALIVSSASGVVAVTVRRIIGPAEIVVRPLPSTVGDVPLIAGVTTDADGNVQLVLDRNQLVDAVRGARRQVRKQASGHRLPILVCDDSLTTRMLEQSILELAGYEVALATSAEEALALARTRKFALFVCDVEMPGMNGFEFVARTRADAELRRTPAILVTSLNKPEDRRRGVESGAAAYIVKGEFDQGVFLDTVRGLVG